MKCENCGKNEVTFVYQSNVNGQVEEKHLCAQCAEKLGYMPALGPARREPAKEERKDGLVDREEESRFARMRQMNALRMEMKEAVRQENFERAAQLRDEIRALEAEHKENGAAQ